MRRRALLQATAAAGGLLAGCLESGEDPERAGVADGGGSPTGTGERSPPGTEGGAPDDGGQSGDDGEATDEPTDDESPETGTSDDGGEETPTETDEATETPDGSAGSNEMVDRSFEVGGAECGRGVDRADVSRGGDRVTVDGTIRGRNGCYTAELERATYDGGTDELTVAVRSYDDSDGGYCQQCIVDVDYRATFEFEDGTPAEVSVFHDDEHVTTE